MAKAYRIPDYKKMYPEAGEDVIAVLKSTERKMQYQEYDLKTERTVNLAGNGAADIVLVKLAWMSNHGTGDVTVLHVEADETGKPELVEYPGNFIQNPDLKPEWIGGWEDYPYPEDISIFAEEPITLDDDCYGAAIIEKDGKTMLCVVRMADAQTDSGMCIDCSYTPEGWYIEDIQMIYDYYGGDWGEKLLGAWNFEPDVI